MCVNKRLFEGIVDLSDGQSKTVVNPTLLVNYTPLVNPNPIYLSLVYVNL